MFGGTLAGNRLKVLGNCLAGDMVKNGEGEETVSAVRLGRGSRGWDSGKIEHHIRSAGLCVCSAVVFWVLGFVPGSGQRLAACLLRLSQNGHLGMVT